MNPRTFVRRGLPKRRKLLLENAVVVTMDKRGTILRDASVAIEDGVIIAIGGSEVKRDFSPEHKVDCRGKIVIPGLIDTHIHLAQAILRGTADDLALIDWLYRRIWPLQGNFTGDDGLVSSALCMLEMIKSGTTTFLESGLHSRYGNFAIAELLYLSGMRGVLSKMVMDGKGYGSVSEAMHPGMIEEKEACLREARELYSAWNGKDDGRIMVWLASRSLGAVSPGLLREISNIASELGTGITMHLNEVKEDSKYSISQYGVSPVAHLKNCGMLGRKTVLAHMVWVTDDEISILANSGSSVSHCPSSNSKLASGIARIPEMIKAGVNVSLGCDGAPCNNTYDMIREMKLASLLQKARTLDPTILNAREVLKIATINGAVALGLERETGSIEVGKRADLVLVNISNAHCVPSFDPVSTLVYSCSGSDVSSVIIDGRVVMADRKVVTLDEERIVEAARTKAFEIVGRTGLNISMQSA